MNDMNKLSAMCERKTADIMARGYAKTGYVLMMADPAADICVSDQGAVSWFTRDQWTWLMHNRDHVEFAWPKPVGAPAAPAAPVGTVDTPQVTAYLKIDGADREYNTIDEFSGGRTGGMALVSLVDAQAYTAAAVAQAIAPLKRQNLELSRVNAEQKLQEGRLDMALQRATERAEKAEQALEEWQFTNKIDELYREVDRLRAQASAPVAATEELRKKLMFAAIDCGHIISDNEITLYADENKGGNALHQLTERLVSAALAAPQQHAQAAQLIADGLPAAYLEMSLGELLDRYWNIAFSEGQDGVSRGSEAQEVLSALMALGKDEQAALDEKDWLNIKVAMIHLKEAKFHTASDNLRDILARRGAMAAQQGEKPAGAA
jgi:hypothetical protein